jgi:NAD(P)-dependent dehydrogenase (short-subunit alcohol dehydrogenase family)
MQKAALITGATRGLGFHTARALARLGYSVVMTGRDEVRGSTALTELRRDVQECAFLTLDVTQPTSIGGCIATVLDRYPHIDVLVNNAGIYIDRTPSPECADTAKVFQDTLFTNAIAPFLLCRLLVPHMLQNGHGRIVNVSSIMGQFVNLTSDSPSYRMSKMAMNAVTRMYARETEGTDVLVNSVCPGWVKTDMGGSNAERSVDVGAQGVVWAATLPRGGPNGGFFRDGKPIDF